MTDPETKQAAIKMIDTLKAEGVDPEDIDKAMKYAEPVVALLIHIGAKEGYHLAPIIVRVVSDALVFVDECEEERSNG